MHLQSRKALHHYTYHLIARGDVLQAKTVRVTNVGQQKFEFKFEVTHDMLPNVKLVAYTVRDDGTPDVATTYIYLKPSLTNSISLLPSVNETQPGQKVELMITTPQKSFVGLLAIDQNVVQLRTGNDLSEIDVTNTLDEYGNIHARPAFGEYQYYNRHQWNSKISSFEVAYYLRFLEIYAFTLIFSFQNVGVFVLSNLKDLIPGKKQ